MDKLVAQVIKGMIGNSTIDRVHFFDLIPLIPTLSDVQINDALHVMKGNGSIHKCNEEPQFGATLIKDFYITTSFSKNYP